MSTENEVCNDIFFEVKKQILDKLDIILQKMNLETINKHYSLQQSLSKTSRSSDFSFIQLSQFQKEISSLFIYLDKLYQSLNTSISAHSSAFMSNSQVEKKDQQLNTVKLKYQQLKKNNLDMRQKMSSLIAKTEQILAENQQLRMKIQSVGYCDFMRSASNKSINSSSKSIASSSKSIRSSSKFSHNRSSLVIEDNSDIHKIQQLLASSTGIKLKNIWKSQFTKQIKSLVQAIKLCRQQIKLLKKYYNNQLKQFKFTMLEDRVQIKAKIKQWQKNNESILTSHLQQIKSNNHVACNYNQNISTTGQNRRCQVIMQERTNLSTEQQTESKNLSSCNNCKLGNSNEAEAIFSELDQIMVLCQATV